MPNLAASIGLIIIVIVVVNVQLCDSNCALNEFECADKVTCILDTQLCNGKVDCPDKSDESNICQCAEKSRKGNFELFFCGAKNRAPCILKHRQCDGFRDCANGADEHFCKDDPIAVTCEPGEWMCDDKAACIPLGHRCDLKEHCLDGSDEKDCNDQCDVYKCQNGKCLDFKEQICDAVDDCGDNSDEHHCDSECTLENGFFRCKDELSCLTIDKLCDNTIQCQDGSDEGNFCKKPCPKCVSGTCVHLPNITYCQCKKGFALNNITSTCEDVDECELFGYCSQICANSRGSYNCSCWPDFHLDADNHTCVPEKPVESWIYYSTRNALYKYNLEKKYDVRILDQLEEVVAIAADDEYVYWTEIVRKDQKICRMGHNGTAIETVVLNGVGSPEGIAIDHWTKNVYFTDSVYKHIVVCGNFGYNCLPLITRGLQKPRAIAIDSPSAKMYWTDWGEIPYIGMAFLDGNGQQIFIDKDLHWPNGLSIDYPKKRLYWADAKTGTLESINLNGQDRRLVMHDEKWHVFNIQVLDSKLYWTDKNQHVLKSVHKTTGEKPDTLSSRKYMRSLYAYHPLIQRKLEDYKNPCHTHRCGQLCLLTEGGGGRCACSNNFDLSGGVNCVDKGHQNLLIGFNNNLYQMEFQEVGMPLLTRKTTKLDKYTISRMTFNTITGDIIVADNKRVRIIMVTPSWVKDVITLVDRDIGLVSSLAFDYLANNLYWTDAVRHSLELLSLKTRIRTIVHLFHGDHSPYSVALAPQIGKLFVAVNADPVLLFQMSLNGNTPTKEQIQPVRKWYKSKGDIADVAMTIDEDNSTIYAVIGRKILSWNYKLGGKNELVYRNDLLAAANSLTMMPIGRHFFWTSAYNGNIYWNGLTAAVDKFMPIYLASLNKDQTNPPVIPIVPYPTRLQPSGHACQTDNGGCSDICVPMGNNTHSCMCSMTRTFKTSQRTTCIEQKDCEFRCLETGLCLPHNKVCDYHPDCGPDDAHSSDEANCRGEHHTYKHATCSYNEFKCDKGEKCLEMSQKCDGHDDCAGGSDELNCDSFNHTTRCHHHQFKCVDTEQCVDLMGLCDGYDDCGDFSDEMVCAAGSLIDLPSCGDLFGCGNGQCIDPNWICDGEQDCRNNGDEAGCHVYFNDTVCSNGYFQCKGYNCIDVRLVCDGHPDCDEGSDEWGCETSSLTTGGPMDQCESDEFRCPSNGTMCIPKTMVCDGIIDCNRGEDERNCSICLENEFECKVGGKCIPKDFVCDKENDCSDKSDELDCDHKTTASITSGTLPIMCTTDMFHCLSGECIDITQVCNNITDCADNSDETDNCRTACNKHKCDHFCDATPSGPKCACLDGYKLATNGRSCQDVNECQDHPCAQMCENTDGSFRCSCYPNFMLHSNKLSCKAMGSHRYVLYGTHSQIRKMGSFPMHKEIFWKEPHNVAITGMAADISRRLLYAATLKLGLIYQINLENKTDTKTVEAGTPEHIAVDWGSGNIYIIDNGATEGPQVRVCNFDSKRCVSVLALRKSQLILSLQIDAKEQLIFYTVRTMLYDSDISMYRCRLDGTKNGIIYTPFPANTVFTLDINRKLIFFVDTEIGAVKEVNYEGQQEGQISKGFKDYVNVGVESMAAYQNYIFLTVPGRPYYITTTAFERAYGQSYSIVNWEVTNAVDFLVIQDTVQPPVENMCAQHRCSKICVPSSRGPKCLCNRGVQIGQGMDCPKGDDESIDLSETYVTPFDALEGTDIEPNIAGRIVLILFLVMAIAAGATYIVYRRRYLMSSFSITNSFTNMSLETSVKKDLPPVLYKPNINRDPEHHAGTEITFDEKASERVIVSSTVSDESGEFSDATHLIR